MAKKLPRKFGVITTFDGRIPTMREAIEADLETGSHNRNNEASKEFIHKYPTIMAVALAIDHQRKKS